MLISCEKCATTYVLDDALIPPQGAPVQCTRCSHVFTAKPGAQAKQTDPGGPAEQSKGEWAGKPTMDFGAGAPVGAAPRNQTMVFGGGSQPPPSSNPPARNQTMVFGSGPQGQPPAQSSPPARNQTMVFGSGPQGQPPAQSSPPARNQTMVFGSGPQAQQSPPSQPPRGSQTMVFGSSPQGQQPPPNQPRSQTMVFGGNSAPQGAANPPARPATPTMAFGTPAAQPQARPGSSTMVFGTPPVQEPAAAPPQSQSPSSTMMFGRAPEAAAPAPAAAPPARNATMVFGNATPRVTAEPAVMPPDSNEITLNTAAPQEHTVRVDVNAMMAAAGRMNEAPDEVQARHDRTQRFAMTPEGQRASGGVAPRESPEAVQDRHNRTQQYAMSSVQETTRPDANLPRELLDTPNPGKPQAVRNSLIDTDPGSPPEDPTVGADPEAPISIDMLSTQPGGRAPSSLEPLRQTMMFGGAAAEGPVPSGVTPLMEPADSDSSLPTLRPGPPPDIATTLPNLPRVDKMPRMPPPRIELPPEPAFVPQPLQLASSDSLPGYNTESIANASKRRNTIAIVIILAIVLGVGGALAWKLFGEKLLGNRLPEAASQQLAAASALLRRDDSGSKRAAVDQLNDFVNTWPDAVEGRSLLVVAMALQYDDVNQQLEHQYTTFNRLNAQVEALQNDRPEGWEAKSIATRKQAEQLKASYETGTGTMKAVHDSLDAALKQLERSGARFEATSPQALSVLRAQAVVQAITGNRQALELEHRYRAQGGQGDPWVETVPAELVLNPKDGEAPKADDKKRAIDQLEALRSTTDGSTFLRAHVLAARLRLLDGDYEGAEQALNTALAMRSEHDVAAELLEWVKAERAAKAPVPD